MVKQKNGIKNRTFNSEIEQLSIQQKNLHIEISNCDDVNRVKELKNVRNKILATIKVKNLEIKENEIEQKLEEVNQSKDTTTNFKAIRQLKRKR